jgi:hypothetical protein
VAHAFSIQSSLKVSNRAATSLIKMYGFAQGRDSGGPESYRFPSHQLTASGNGAWADELRKDLAEYLKDVETPGSFFTNNALNAAINPGLDVPVSVQLVNPFRP